MTFRFTIAALAACLTLSAPLPVAAEAHPPTIHVHDVYARANGGVGKTGAVFLMLHNMTETDDRLLAARADVAERVELHTHLEGEDGVMQMRPIEGGIALPAGAMHELARGGDHVMLLGLTRALADGETFALTLVFQTAGEVTVEAVVDNARKPGTGAMDHDAMHGEGHGGGHGHGMTQGD